MIVDTHLHIVDMAVLDYPWLGGAGDLNRNWLYEDYAREARRLGIVAAMHTEVDVAEPDIDKETAYVAKLAARHDTLLVGAITACRPEDKGFPDQLERALAGGIIKGFRRVLHVMPDDLSTSPLFRENIRRLAGTGLTFDLCVLPRQIGQAIELVDFAPDVRFVLDHCGVPDIKGGAYDDWAAGIAEIARRPNVVGKLSGIVAYTDTANWSLDAMRPYAEHTIGAFGFDRMVWGSDWPVCTLGGGLSTWVGATHALLEGASKDEKHALLAGNAMKIWDLEV